MPSTENRQIVAENRNNGRETLSKVQVSSYSAPIPSPEMMEAYEKVVPGSAERIIKRFEIQSDHRQSCEKILVWTNSVKSIVGLVFGFIVTLIAIFGGIYTALQGKPWLGGTLSLSGLAMLVGAFITGKISSARESKKE